MSVADTCELSVLVEPQIEFVGQFYLIIAIAPFVDLCDEGSIIGALHLVGDGGWHQMGGNSVVLAVHLLPVAVLVKLQLPDFGN